MSQIGRFLCWESSGAILNTGDTTKPIAWLEWPTLALIVSSYAIWILLATNGDALHPALWVLISALNVTLFMSITHEVLHGHPTRNALLNRLMILVPIGWSLPYERFRDTHLKHHSTGELTDPFDDPESWYFTSSGWSSLNSILKTGFVFNNTLFGRMLIGPMIGLGTFYVEEAKKMISVPNIRAYLLSVWAVQLSLCFVMILFISVYSSIPAWQWVVSIYLGHSILLVRTYLEHQAAPNMSERTVIIETPCPIAFLFLFNNYHFIHHERPGIPWYSLPGEFSSNRETYLSRNGYYVYRSYLEIFRKFFFRAKEPVAHPFLNTDI